MRDRGRSSSRAPCHSTDAATGRGLERTYTWTRRGVRQGTSLATPDHPVLGVDGRWTRVRDLKPGDRRRALYRGDERMGSRRKPYASVLPARGLSRQPASFVQEPRFVMTQVVGPIAEGDHVDRPDNRSLNRVRDNAQVLSQAAHSRKSAKNPGIPGRAAEACGGSERPGRGRAGEERRRTLPERLPEPQRQGRVLNHRVVSVPLTVMPMAPDWRSRTSTMLWRTAWSSTTASTRSPSVANDNAGTIRCTAITRFYPQRDSARRHHPRGAVLRRAPAQHTQRVTINVIQKGMQLDKRPGRCRGNTKRHRADARLSEVSCRLRAP